MDLCDGDALSARIARLWAATIEMLGQLAVRRLWPAVESDAAPTVDEALSRAQRHLAADHRPAEAPARGLLGAGLADQPDRLLQIGDHARASCELGQREHTVGP